MRKSKFITLGFLGLVATSTACDEPTQIEHCVDEKGVVVDTTLCNSATNNPVYLHSGGYVHHIIYHPTYHPVGAVIVSGGSSRPLSGRAVVTHAVAARGGGFGSVGTHLGLAGGA